MLCPEVWNFPPPKVIELKKQKQDSNSVNNIINRNCFYKSLIITCVDELQPPTVIQELITEDSDYYKLLNCSLTEFTEYVFIENFVKKGKLYCLSTDRNCIVQNCAAITPDGILTLHILDYIFQTLGFEGIKRPHKYFEIKIDLKTLQNNNKVKLKLSKLELFDFYILWEPDSDEICPSSIAKYFSDRNVSVSVHSLEVKNITPNITEVPSIKDVDIEEIVEWTGLLAYEVDLKTTEPYISSYSQPESEDAIKTSRISVYIIKGFISNSLVSLVGQKLEEFVKTKAIDSYWSSLSLQSDENSLWQWNASSPKMFQAHNSSCNIFFTHHGHNVYLIGQLKYS